MLLDLDGRCRSHGGDGVVAGVVEQPSSVTVQRRNAHEVAKFTFNSEREPIVKLRQQHLQVHPAQLMAEHGNHARERCR